MKYLSLLAGLALLAGGCAHYPPNPPLASTNIQQGYRVQNSIRTNSDELLLALSFSGGGARAAALSYGVLEELAKTGIETQGREHRLLDDVEIISSVSGGSITAASYTLWGDRLFTEFEPKFLKRHFQTGLLLRTLAPWNQVRLASPKFGRSDLAAEYYDHLLFHGATFGDLTSQPHRPFLIVNATDLAIGARFEFTQDQFDFIRSDLSKFPISRAVAASSAFPVVLTPVVLKNHSAERPQPVPDRIKAVVADPKTCGRLKNLALQQRSYLDGDRRKFIHLVDGGIADNLGLRGPVECALQLEGPPITATAAVQIPRRLAVIIVDANTDKDYGWDSRERSRGLAALIGSIGHEAVSRASFETIELFREVSARINQGRETYIIELHFSQVAHEADRRFFNSVQTSLQLHPKTVDRLRQLAARELADNPEFKRLLRDLAGPSPGADHNALTHTSGQ